MCSAVLFGEAFSSYADRVVTEQLTFRSEPDHFILGLSVDALNSGTVLSERIHPAPSASPQTKSFSHLMSEGKEGSATLIRDTDRHFGILRNEIRNFELVRRVPRGEKAVTIPRAEGLVFNLEQFQNCSIEIAPAIQQLIRFENLRTESLERERMNRHDFRLVRRMAEQRIRSTRGDGTETGLRGVACGKFLGRAGFNIAGMVDDFKILTSVLKREELGEVNLLLMTAITAFHTNSPPPIKRVWRKYWEILSFHANFKPDPLPNWETIRPMLQNVVGEPGLLGVIPMTQEELDRIHEDGINFARTQM